MNEPDVPPSTDLPEDLFRIRARLESLTRRYVDTLLSCREAAENHAAMLSTILESAADGLVVFDKDQRIILANHAAARIAGWELQDLSREELRTKYTFFKKDGKTPLSLDEEPLVVAMREGRAVEMEGLVTGHLLPAEGIWLRAHAAPITDKDGTLIGGVTLFQDITERRRLQKQRDALATLITHDIKNHLAGESSFIEMLITDYSGVLKEDDLVLLSEIKKGNQLYLDITMTLLELLRTELFQEHSCAAPIDLSALLQSVVQLNSQHAAERGVDIMLNTVEDLPPLQAIPSSLHQVFHNLVQNAINVSKPGQAICISVSKSGSWTLVEIVDQGPGMTPDQVQDLFNPAKAAARTPSASTSTGFGLYLCGLLIEAQGGRISCKSKPGEGTTFYVELRSQPR